MAKKQPPEETAFVLRCCASDGTSRNGFKWPGVGETAAAPDWKDNGNCGHGLHGWLYGQGDHTTCDYLANEDALWLVVEVKKSDIRMLGGKCKFHSGVVRFAGMKEQAAEYLVAHEPQAALVAVIGRSVTVGENEIATVGDLGTATAGDRGTATAGYRGTATAGYRGTATAGYSGTATAGYSGTATAGDLGTATAGYSGTATAGDSGTATAGDSGTATAGDRGTATAGYSGTATAGDLGTATAGYSGTICIKYWDDKKSRYRMVVGYVGEDNIKANVAYRLDDDHKFVEVSK